MLAGRVTGLKSRTERYPGQAERSSSMQPLPATSHLSCNCSKLLQSSWLISSIWLQGPQDILQNRKGLQKKHTFHLPACLCSLPGSVLPRREAASNLPGRSRWKCSATFTAAACKPDNKLMRGVHWVWKFQDQLPPRAFLKYNSSGYHKQITQIFRGVFSILDVILT